MYGDCGVRSSAEANAVSLFSCGECTAPCRLHTSHGEGSMSLEYTMARLNCLVVKVGLIVVGAFLPSPHSVPRHTLRTYFFGFEGEILGHNLIFFALSSVTHAEIGPVSIA